MRSETGPGAAELGDLSRHFHKRASLRLPLVIAFLVWPLTASAEQTGAQGFALRNQNPFLQVFGLPPFQSATPAAKGDFRYDIGLDIVSHADAGENALEDVAIDGESYFLTLSWRRGVAESLELGIDVPVVGHAGGFLDNAIEGWHDFLGLSNSKRRGPNNQLGFRYLRAGNTLYELDSPAFGLGDIQLTAAIPLRRADGSGDLSVAVRASIKLPTGADDELRGSGATDFAMGLYASNRHRLFKRDLEISGFAGVLLLGDGDVLGEIQRSAVPYGGVAATWWMTDRFGIAAQLYGQGAYFDSEIDELGGESAQLAVGIEYRPTGSGLSLLLSIVEDVVPVTTTTPDFAVHFSVRKSSVF